MALKIFRLPERWNRKDRIGLWRAGIAELAGPGPGHPGDCDTRCAFVKEAWAWPEESSM